MGRPKGSKNKPKTVVPQSETLPPLPPVSVTAGTSQNALPTTVELVQSPIEPPSNAEPLRKPEPSAVSIGGVEMERGTWDILLTMALRELNPLQIRRLFRDVLERQGFRQVEHLYSYMVDRCRFKSVVMQAFKIAKALDTARKKEIKDLEKKEN